MPINKNSTALPNQDITAIADELLGCLLASLPDYRLKKEVPVERVPERG